MNHSEIARLIADATPPPTLAGDAYAVETEADLYATPDMTDAATRATWTEEGLRLFMARIRAVYGDEFVQRIASVQRIESDEPRTILCRECFEREPILGPSKLLGRVILRCGHTARLA
jgi:hypothetical protein